MTGSTYVVYYGWLSDAAQGEPNGVAQAIAAAGAPLLIAHLRTALPASHRNISPQVLSLMHTAGTEVFGYAPTTFGRADPARVRRDVAENLEGGVDGIFFDEADPLTSEALLDYYAGLAQQVREAGKRVILNTGVSRCGERIMQVADRVMVEHRWPDLAAFSPWTRRYPAERFMGVSSNEGDAMGYRVDGPRAIEDTRKAWQAGIGWHTATDRYVGLPDWFADYVLTVKSLSS